MQRRQVMSRIDRNSLNKDFRTLEYLLQNAANQIRFFKNSAQKNSKDVELHLHSYLHWYLL